MDKTDDEIDQMILSLMKPRTQKVLRIIAQIVPTDLLKLQGQPAFDDACDRVAERIYFLADTGVLEAHGNVRKWGSSEIRLSQN